MRKILSVAILAACLFAPVQRLDVAKLQPVQTVAVYRQGEKIVLETDEGDKGHGASAQEALKNLKDNALTVIYLDTAEYLLVGEEAQEQAEQLRPILHKTVKVGPYNGGDIAEEAAYWELHGKLPEMQEWNPSPKE